MNKANLTQQTKNADFMPPVHGLLQRQCACGNHTVAGEECAECAKKKSNLQRKLTIGASNDPLEQEADRVANQVMAVSKHSAVGTVLPHIQRYSGQANEGMDTAPASVDHVLASSGRPLEPTLRQDMESRFGHDFSDVRIHTGSAAEQSAQDVNAHAYTVGNDVVFGAGQFAPQSGAGKKLIAHELTHTLQQTPVIRRTVFHSDIGGVGHPLPSEKPSGEKSKKETENKACTQIIMSEGTCEHLAKHSKWTCCDPDKGIEDKSKTTSQGEPGKQCPSQKWTPIFTCEGNCKKALQKGCDDNDNWMAIPTEGKNYKEKYKYLKSRCDDQYTICANGKQTKGYVRDGSDTEKSYEVSPGIQKALGVTVGGSFKGFIYPPDAKQTTIDENHCCSNMVQQNVSTKSLQRQMITPLGVGEHDQQTTTATMTSGGESTDASRSVHQPASASTSTEGARGQSNSDVANTEALSGFCIRTPLGPGQIRFSGCSTRQLGDYSVMPESGKTLSTPVNGTWYDSDGFWFRHHPRNEWFKVGDHCDLDVNCESDNTFSYSYCCNAFASLIWGVPGWKSDAHATTNPFS